MIGPNVVIRDPKTADFVLKTSNFQEVTGYRTPLAFLEGKALQGDDSDVIPGIPKMGEKTAAEFLATWGSVFNFFKAVDSGEYTPKKRTSEKAKSLHPEEFLASPQGRRIFLRNLKIMQLLNVARPQEGEMVVKPGAVNKQAFAELCEELAFSSILRDLDRFFAPFEN
jgi:5'-3' exonuclease